MWAYLKNLIKTDRAESALAPRVVDLSKEVAEFYGVSELQFIAIIAPKKQRENESERVAIFRKPGGVNLIKFFELYPLDEWISHELTHGYHIGYNSLIVDGEGIRLDDLVEVIENPEENLFRFMNLAGPHLEIELVAEAVANSYTKFQDLVKEKKLLLSIL